jgi:lactoylglutathione lyase
MPDSAGPIPPSLGSVTTWNHVGHHVADLDRSVGFYTAVFGFEELNRMQIPDAAASRLLRVPEPVGLTAVYLGLGGAVLELLHLDRPGNEPARERPFSEPGLTHLSLTVDDLAAACEAVRAHGGEVLTDTDMGGRAILVRDPDGQVLELLPPGALDGITSGRA